MKKLLLFVASAVVSIIFGYEYINAQNPWKEYTNVKIDQPMGIECFGDTVMILGTMKNVGQWRYQIKYSHNNGSTWDSVSVPALTTAMYFLNSQRGWALVDTQYRAPAIYFTEDGGRNWQFGFQFPKDYNVPFNRNNMQLLESGTGYFCSQGYLFKTEDGGRNFTMKYLGRYIFDALGFASDNIGWIGYNNGRLEKTDDGGLTWNEQEPDVNSVSTVHVVNQNNVYVGGLFKVGITKDGGASWDSKQTPDHTINQYIRRIQVIPPTIWALYSDQVIYSNDGGDTWNVYSITKIKDDEINAFTSIIDFAMRDNDFGWMVGDGGILHYDAATGIGDNYSKNNVSVAPNPFSESTTINYELGMAGRVRIDIFNSLGEKITTLVDEWQEAGRHSTLFDVGNTQACCLQSGMYYYTVQIGERLESGKLVLIR